MIVELLGYLEIKVVSKSEEEVRRQVRHAYGRLRHSRVGSLDVLRVRLNPEHTFMRVPHFGHSSACPGAGMECLTTPAAPLGVLRLLGLNLLADGRAGVDAPLVGRAFEITPGIRLVVSAMILPPTGPRLVLREVPRRSAAVAAPVVT